MKYSNKQTLTKLSATFLLCFLAGGLAISAPVTSEGDHGKDRQWKSQAEQPGQRRHMIMKRLANRVLTEEEQTTLREARQEVMNDEEVQAALQDRPKSPEQRRELRELIHAKMLENDPSVEPLLQKMRDAAQELRQNRGERREKLSNLTDEQRQTLKDAREQAMEQPQVQEARENLKSAETPEDRQAAAKKLRENIHEAMKQASPEVQEILDSADSTDA